MPVLRRVLSVQLRSGTWQVPQATVPLPDKRWSKKRCIPNSIASRFPDARLVGSGGAKAPNGPWVRICLISLSVKTGFAGTPSSAKLVQESRAQAAPATSIAVR